MSSRSGETLGDAGALGGGQGTVQTRIYKGRTIDEVIPLIQRELGADAIIVRRREGLSGGVLGFFQHPYVEIEAMPGGPRIDIYDEDEPPRPPGTRNTRTTPRSTAPAAGSRSAARSRSAAAGRAPRRTAVLHAPPGGARCRHGVPQRTPGRARTRTPAPAAPREARAAGRLRLPGASAEARTRAAPAGTPRRGTALGGARLALACARRRRTVAAARRDNREAGPRADRRCERAHATSRARPGLAQAVRTTLAQRIPVAPALPVQGAAIVLVGAGGAGKTTCSAALLGAYRSGSTLPASFATLTRERTTGELQMILSPALMKPVPASGPRALRALRKARSTGLALIDTPPLSPSDRAQIRARRPAGEACAGADLLALPATLGARAASQLLSALVPLGANSLVVTHADEQTS